MNRAAWSGELLGLFVGVNAEGIAEPVVRPDIRLLAERPIVVSVNVRKKSIRLPLSLNLCDEGLLAEIEQQGIDCISAHDINVVAVTDGKRDPQILERAAGDCAPDLQRSVLGHDDIEPVFQRP